MFGIAEHDGRELPNVFFFFYEIAFFLLFFVNLFQFNDLINKF